MISNSKLLLFATMQAQHSSPPHCFRVRLSVWILVFINRSLHLPDDNHYNLLVTHQPHHPTCSSLLLSPGAILLCGATCDWWVTAILFRLRRCIKRWMLAPPSENLRSLWSRDAICNAGGFNKVCSCVRKISLNVDDVTAFKDLPCFKLN